MFVSHHPSAPDGQTSNMQTWPRPAFRPPKPQELLVLNLSLALRQRVIDNLNSFSQLLHGKPLSESESDELTSSCHSLAAQLMSLRVRSIEEKLQARINEEQPTFTVSGQSAKVLITSKATNNPFNTRMVSELTWPNRERIISNLVANFNLVIHNKALLTHEFKTDLIRENDELSRLLSALPTVQTLEPDDKPTESVSSGKMQWNN